MIKLTSTRNLALFIVTILLVAQDVIPAQTFVLSWTSFKYPGYVKNCEELVLDVTVENTGNTTLTYTISTTEDGTANPGWLAIANFDGSIPSGGNNKEAGQISLNVGGGIGCPAGVGNAAYETGRVTFDFDDTRTVFDFEIEMYVVDTVIAISWDTVATTCLSLIVGNNGNAGKSGNRHMGGLNMDFSENGDWKESADTYLFDGSIVAGWVDGTDTAMYFGMFYSGHSVASSNSFRPLGGLSKNTVKFGTAVNTGDYCTDDTTLVFNTTWYAHGNEDSCNFYIKETIVTAPNGATNVVIGEVVDFDVPSDSSDDYNSSGSDFTYSGYEYVYQQGIEIPGWNDTSESWDADNRFAGLIFLGVIHYNAQGNVIGTSYEPYALYTADNATYHYPFSNGFDNSLLYQNHTQAGTNLSLLNEDLHSGLTYVANYDIAAGDTLYLFSAFFTIRGGHIAGRTDVDNDLASVANKVTSLFADLDIFNQTCCRIVPGDVNFDGRLNIKDLTDRIDYMFKGGATPSCLASLDVNADGETNIVDLTYHVAYAFKNGPELKCLLER